jgi:membrane protease YdiL (CAAX protease family)
MDRGMILWLPIIIIRPFIAGRKTLFLDISLLLIGIICILNSDSKFKLETSWWYLPLYFLLAMMVFIGSVLLTTGKPIEYLQKTFQSILHPVAYIHKRAAWIALKTSVAEELVWRVVLQTVLISVVGVHIGVLVIAISFALLHRQRTSGLTIQFVEMLLFSFLVGGLFALTNDPVAIITIHGMRNYLIGIREASYEAQ